MKFLTSLLLVGALYSCSKNTDDPPPSPAKTGTVSGSLMAYTKYGTQNTANGDVVLQLIDKNNKIFNGAVDAAGNFRFENIVLGEVVVVVAKPGYGFTDSVKFVHQKAADTLTAIYLVEEMPFAYNLDNLHYFNGQLNIAGSYSYQSPDPYWVGNFYVFGKDAQVSVNHNSLLLALGGQTNAQVLNTLHLSGANIPLKTFTDAGFKVGDKVYASVLPSIPRFIHYYFDTDRNYQVLHYKVSNASKVASFTLNQ